MSLISIDILIYVDCHMLSVRTWFLNQPFLMSFSKWNKTSNYSLVNPPIFRKWTWIVKVSLVNFKKCVDRRSNFETYGENFTCSFSKGSEDFLIQAQIVLLFLSYSYLLIRYFKPLLSSIVQNVVTERHSLVNWWNDGHG